jgi:hypothetical protein
VAVANGGWDDEQLFGALREALKARNDVPSGFVEAGKGAYAWRAIDAELARLTYDSSRDSDRSAAVRSESASVRSMTFTSARASIEIEVTEGSLVGQIIPPGEGTLDVLRPDGVSATAPIDEIGCFSIEPLPLSPFRLHCRTARGDDVLTGWVIW